MSVVWSVLEQHVESAAILWLQRDQATSAPHWRLSDLIRHDARLEGHLDALEVAGAAGWTASAGELRWSEPGEVFVAAHLAIRSQDPRRLETVLDTVGQSRELERPLVSALAWLDFPAVEPLLGDWLESSEARLRRIAIAAHAAQRQDPGDALARAIEDADDGLATRALRAAGELGRRDLVPRALEHSDSSDAEIRREAAWTIALLDDRPDILAKATRTLRAAARAAREPCRRRLALGLLRGPVEEVEAWVKATESDPARGRLASIAAGILGDSGRVGTLIERLGDPSLARSAGEAITTITGLDLTDREFEGKPPRGFHAGPTDDPDDENVAMDPDENLPWPNGPAVAGWWERRAADFPVGTPLLAGEPRGRRVLETILRDGLLRQRNWAAVILAGFDRGFGLFETRADGRRQQSLLGASKP